MAAALGPEEGDDAAAAHVGEQPRRGDRVALGVVPLQHQLHFGQDLRAVVNLSEDFDVLDRTI